MCQRIHASSAPRRGHPFVGSSTSTTGGEPVDPDATQKTALYREVNATTEAMLKQFAADHAGSFLCECPDVGCDRRLALTYQEYERVRVQRAYLVSLDCVGDADVLARTDRYARSEEHTSELQSPCNLVCRLLLEKKNTYE